MVVLQEFINRLNEYLRENKLSNAAFAEKLECSPTYISYLLSAKRNPSKSFINKLVAVTGKSATWWLHGEKEYKGLLALNELLDSLIRNNIIKTIEDYDKDEDVKKMIDSMIRSELKVKLKEKE